MKTGNDNTLISFNGLNIAYQNIFNEEKIEPEKQFLIGKSLIEGKSNINLGLKYIEASAKSGFIDSIIYYVKLLIKGEIIMQNLKLAQEYIENITEVNDDRLYF